MLNFQEWIQDNETQDESFDGIWAGIALWRLLSKRESLSMAAQSIVTTIQNTKKRAKRMMLKKELDAIVEEIKELQEKIAQKRSEKWSIGQR